jgi:hypothetical protein
MGTGIVLLPATTAMDDVAAALDASAARYEDIHDGMARLRAEGVVCIVVDAAADSGAADGSIRRFRRESSAAVVLAIDPDDGAAAIGADVAAVVDRTAPATTARRLEEIRSDELLDRSARRSSGAETLLRAAAETVRSGERDAIEPLVDDTVTSVGGTDPYPVVWAGQHDTERRVVRPLAAAGTPIDHLRAVPVGGRGGTGGESGAGTGSDTGGEGTTSVTRRAVTADGGAAVFTEPLDGSDRSPADDEGTHLVALRVPTSPVVVFHLVAGRPGGVPMGERRALTALGSALAAAVADGTTGSGNEDRLRLLADVLAHELSNQLGAASLQLDLAREHGDDEHFDHVARALDRLEGLTEETRALARPEPDLEWTDLGTVVDSAWTAISTPNATLEVSSATLNVDAPLVRLAAINLLRNAVEHGRADTGADDEDDGSPDLRVEVGPVGDDEGFYVADDGHGIPEAERDRVLEWGYSGGDSTGVGLGLVRVVAERHGWEVAVEESAAGGAHVALGPEESL